MEAIILAGGLGTRLRSVIADVPKPMAEISGRPFLEYQLDYLIEQGVTRVVFAVGYKAEFIKSHFCESYKSIEIVYSVEKTLLGTGGAIQQALSFCCTDNVFVFNGDSLFILDLTQMFLAHKASQLPVTLAVKLEYDCSRYGTVEFDQNNTITSFIEKMPYRNRFINTGLYCINNDLFDKHKYPTNFSFEKDYLEIKAKQGKLKSFRGAGYFIDIGTPEDYSKAERYFSSL